MSHLQRLFCSPRPLAWKLRLGLGLKGFRALGFRALGLGFRVLGFGFEAWLGGLRGLGLAGSRVWGLSV